MVKKAHFKAKGVLTLVPILKIDEIYVKLKGCLVYSIFNMRKGYYYTKLNPNGDPSVAL